MRPSKSRKTSHLHTTMEMSNNKKKQATLPVNVRREEMDIIFQQCRADGWEKVLQAVTKNPNIGVGLMVMDNHISTTIIHQAITSKGDTNLRAKVILKILAATPQAAFIKNGYGSLPLHVIAQRNTKMNSVTKETLMNALVRANVDALVTEGGTAKRTPLHIIFTDYISPTVTQMMINHGKRACFMRDKNGWLPAHVACSRHASPEKLRMLLAVNPAALYDKTDDGRSLLDLAESTATKAHPNFALKDELNQQLERRKQATISQVPRFLPRTPVSSEDSGSTRSRVGSSDSANSHPSIAEVAENMGNVAVTSPGQQGHHLHSGSWNQQPHPYPYQLQPPYQQLQMQHAPHPQPQGQRSRKRTKVDDNAASEALLLLSRDQSAGNWGDDYDDEKPLQFAKV